MKKIDYSCLVGSQVLMEFWHDGCGHIFDFLHGVTPETKRSPSQYQIEGLSEGFDNCRIYQSPEYWISCVTSPLKLPDGLQINLMFNDGVLIRDHSSHDTPFKLGSEYRDTELKVIAVQVTGIAEGYTE